MFGFWVPQCVCVCVLRVCVLRACVLNACVLRVCVGVQHQCSICPW
jgi:hypothetical protein